MRSSSINLPNFHEENQLWKQGYRLVIGVDEVGRGAIAGPLVASACAFAAHSRHAELVSASHSSGKKILKQVQDDKIKIDDSKRLKPEERKRAAKWIKENCLAFGVGEMGVGTINRVGIGKATEQAMRLAIRKLLDCYIVTIVKENNNSAIEQFSNNCFVLVDAFHIKHLRGIGLKNQKAIVKGDQKSISIAAASIVAKVYRDCLMQRLTKRYSQYAWGVNKGYGTKVHKEAILKNGITNLHRTQFVQTFLAS